MVFVSRLFFCVAIFGAASANADAYAAAMLPLSAPDLLEPQKRAIDDRIRDVAAEMGISMQPAADTAKSVEQAKKAGAACNMESLACQAQMGVLLGAKQVIVARVASDWAGDRLELRLLDALRGLTLREAAHLLPKDAVLRARVTDGVILSVLAPKKTGAIAVTTANARALFLDGIAVPPQTAEPLRIEGLAPGDHDLELRVEGAAPLKERVVVVSGKTASVSIGAAPIVIAPPVTPPDDGLSTGLLLVGGGAVLAAAAGAGAGGLQAALEYSAMERGTRSALQVTGITLLGATAIGVVVAGTGGVLMAVGEGP